MKKSELKALIREEVESMVLEDSVDEFDELDDLVDEITETYKTDESILESFANNLLEYANTIKQTLQENKK